MTASGGDDYYVGLINGTRLELEQAGNPSYVVVIVDAAGEAHLSSMVFATSGPANDHAARLASHTVEGERVLIVNRSEAGRRAMFTVVEPKTLRKLHQQLEVIEQTFAESEGPL
jgi:hypothetical protein